MSTTTVDRSQSYVTDPFPTQPSGDEPRCEFKIYPTPDAVEFCENQAIAVLIAPCCGAVTHICAECITRCPSLTSWICHGCGTRTECRWKAVVFVIRRLT